MTPLDFIAFGATAASVFGAIMTIVSFYNGRATRRYVAEFIAKESRLTRSLIEDGNKRMERLIEDGNKRMERMEKILEKTTEILSRIDGRLQRIEEAR